MLLSLKVIDPHFEKNKIIIITIIRIVQKKIENRENVCTKLEKLENW